MANNNSNNVSGTFNRLWSLPINARLTIMGLEGSGKTAALYNLNLNETVSAHPTIGFNLEMVQHRNVNFSVYDLGGLARGQCVKADALIFVVDSADRARLEESRTMLHALLQQEELCDAALIVLANKQDLPNAMGVQDMTAFLGLCQMKQQQPWCIQGCVATKPGSLYKGLSWLAGQLGHKERTGSWRLPMHAAARLGNRRSRVVARSTPVSSVVRTVLLRSRTAGVPQGLRRIGRLTRKRSLWWSAGSDEQQAEYRALQNVRSGETQV